MDITGETILITGASSGIGRALAISLAEHNIVIALGRNGAKLGEMASGSDNIHPLIFDVSDATAIHELERKLQQLVPHIDRIILNAGDCRYLEPEHLEWSHFDRMMDVNFFGWINVLRASMPLLEKSQHPHVIGVASQVVFAPFSRASAYGASKAAAAYFLKSLALDIAYKNIDTSVIYPGFIDTPLTQKNDFAMPFLMSVESATERMLGAIAQRKREYIFPKRLKWLLNVSKIAPNFWFHKMTWYPNE